MSDDMTLLRRQLAEARSNLYDTQAELAGVRRELGAKNRVLASTGGEFGAEKAETDRLKAALAEEKSLHESNLRQLAGERDGLRGVVDAMTKALRREPVTAGEASYAVVADLVDLVAKTDLLRLEWEARIAHRDNLRNAAMCAYGCPTPSFRDAAIAGGWDGETQTDYERCLNKTWVEHVRTCPGHPQRAVERELADLHRLVGIPDGVNPKTLLYWCGTEEQWQGMRRGVVANAIAVASIVDESVRRLNPVSITEDAFRAGLGAPSPEEQVAVLMRERDEARKALESAAKSLEWIAFQSQEEAAGNIRVYAQTRASVARAVLP